MKIQQIINSIFRQDFKDNLVLGRSIFAVSIIALGFNSFFNVADYVSYAPSYIRFAGLFVVLVGTIFIIAGSLILANAHLKKTTNVLMILFALFIIIIYLLSGDVYSIIQSVGFIGAALLIHSLSTPSAEDASKIK